VPLILNLSVSHRFVQFTIFGPHLYVTQAFFIFLGPIVVEVDSSDDEPLIESVGKARVRLSDETSAASPKPKDQK